MSSSLIIKIKKKGQCAKEALTLIELSTTPTRELLREVHFPQPNLNKGFEKSEYWPETEVDAEYGYYSILSMDSLNEIINFYQSKVDSFNASIAREEEKINRLLKIPTSSAEAVNAVIEQIDEAQSYINSLKGVDDNDYWESLAYYEDLRNQFISVRSIYNLSCDYNEKTEFELVIFAA